MTDLFSRTVLDKDGDPLEVAFGEEGDIWIEVTEGDLDATARLTRSQATAFRDGLNIAIGHSIILEGAGS